MKVALTLVLSVVGGQEITVDQHVLTHFSTTYDFTGHLPDGMSAYSLTPQAERRHDFWDVTEQGRVSLDFFGEKLHIKGSGSGTECSGERKYPPWVHPKPLGNCRDGSPTSNAIMSGMKTKVGGEVFVDGTTGHFGFRGVERDDSAAGFEAQLAFCAVVKIPKGVLPPPQVLRRPSSRFFERLQMKLNKLPHTTEDGVATFAHKSEHADQSFSVRVDTGAPVQAKSLEGWNGEHYDVAVGVKFGNFVQPYFPKPFTCPTGSSTDLDAHPEVLGSLAALDLIVQQLRQYEDLTWLPEQPSAFFVEQIATKDKPEQENRHWTLLVGSLVAGMSGGFIVLALANFLTKKQHQEPLLSDA